MNYVNKHLEHIEDAFLGNQPTSALDAFFFVTGKTSRFITTTKWDGGLSFVFGAEPGTGVFMIGTKGVFNKKPKYATSFKQIRELYKPEVATLLEGLWDNISRWEGTYDRLYQADLMWDPTTKGDLGTFKPNTITYDACNAFGFGHQNLVRNDYGIVIHTQYTGSCIKTLYAQPYIDDFSHPHKIANVYTIHSEQIYASLPKWIEPAYITLVGQLTTYIRSIETTPLSAKQIAGLKQYINFQIKTHGDKYLGTLSTQTVLDWDTLVNKKRIFDPGLVMLHYDIERRLQAFRVATDLKMLMMGPMVEEEMANSWFRAKEGPEGFVIYDQLRDRAWKLVDRGQFSYQNFKQHGEVING